MACHNFGRFACGKCAGCYAARASDWSVRLAHEKTFHDESSFITLTLSDDSIVDVDKEICVLFLKRVRRRLEPKRIRYYLVSEYGEKNGRPHYHAIIFGHDFSKDAGSVLVRRGLFTSPLLEQTWGAGHVSSGSVSEASIRYVANYVLGKEAVPKTVDLETGVERMCQPVFSLMSRNPGIGARWIDKHAGETYRDDDVVVAGFRRRPPRYYERRVFGDDEMSLANLRSQRRSVKLKKMLERPATWLSNMDPLRKRDAALIWKSKRALRDQGEL